MPVAFAFAVSTFIREKCPQDISGGLSFDPVCACFSGMSPWQSWMLVMLRWRCQRCKNHAGDVGHWPGGTLWNQGEGDGSGVIPQTRYIEIFVFTPLRFYVCMSSQRLCSKLCTYPLPTYEHIMYVGGSKMPAIVPPLHDWVAHFSYSVVLKF